MDSPRPLRVLVVDDEKVIADTLVEILRLCHYDASAVYSAEEAIARCETQSPDAVISDVVMGTMNGIQFAIYLAENHPECKILLISGNTHTQSLMTDSIEINYRFQLFAKPVHPAKVLEFLAKVQGVTLPRSS